MLSTAYSFSYLKTATAGNSMSVAEFQYQYCEFVHAFFYCYIFKWIFSL